MIFWEIVVAALVALLLTVLLTPYVRRVALRVGAIRHPGNRHTHARPTPLLGGVGIALVSLLVLTLHPTLVLTAPIIALLLGIVLLMIVGIADDLFDLPWWGLLLAQVAAALLLIGSGVKLPTLHNPFGGVVDLSTVPFLAAALLLVWVIVVMNAVNWLDGADGIASGVVSVALLTLAATALLPNVLQPPLAIIAAVVAGATVGFLFWNRPPAKIFLGSSGSFVLGFIVAALAVLAGAKIATAAIVLLIPLADMLAVVVKRFMRHRRITRADTSHVHFLLQQRGVLGSKLLALYVAAAVALGVVSYIVPQPQKTLLLGAMFFGLVTYLIRLDTLGKERKE